MALFSQRFWLQLTVLDARVVASQRAQQQASSRLLVGRRLVTGSSLVDYWIELEQTTRTANSALGELNCFCAGRSKRSAPLAIEGNALDRVSASTPFTDSGLALG